MTDILLAVYNGERYLPALSQRLRSQSCGDFRVLCRDDGSRDGTPALLETYAREGKIVKNIVVRNMSPVTSYQLIVKNSP